MVRLIVAEKPSVARDLARVLGVKSKGNGFLQGNGWLISWCIGHLVELCEPHEYNPQWKRWSLQSLPMLPQDFRLRPQKNTKKQFDIVSRLLNRRDVESVVNACDAGREGELIFRYLYVLANAKKPVQRLWISSMTDEAIRRGFASLRDGRDFDPLWDAARCRSEADWLVGMNATRAMTLRGRQVVKPGQDAPLFSIGRVQTPTLSLVVRREREIVDFVPKDYWQLYAHCQAEKGQYRGKWFHDKVDRFFDEREAKALQEHLAGHDGHIEKCERRKATEAPPLLFDLTRLQRTANKRYGFSAKRTLEIAQALYEKRKLITYPRTDSAFLPSDMKAKMQQTIRAVDTDPYTPFVETLLSLNKLPMPRRVFNDKKVSDHHAIIPTTKRPSMQSLNQDEFRIYDLIVRRFLAAFFPNAVFEKTTVITVINEHTFVTKGKVLVDAGWRHVLGLPDPGTQRRRPQRERDDGKEEEEEQGLLPPLKRGETVAVEELELQAKKTKPPPRYTEATLLSGMEGAGKMLDDEAMQQAMKDRGLGTPATRASIIENLISRQYLTRKGKTILPTDKGMRLVEALPVDNLKSPELTGSWEALLAQIARGEFSADAFQQQVRDFVHTLTQDIKQASLQALANMDLPAAPARFGKGKGKGRSKAKSRSKGGSRSKAKSKSISKGSNAASQDGTDKRRSTRSKQKKVVPTSTSSSGSSYSRDPSQHPSQRKRAPQASTAAPQRRGIGPCPKCQEGQIIRGRQAWGCERWREGCRTTLPFHVQGREISIPEMQKLMQQGQLGPLHGFLDSTGKKQTGTLRLQHHNNELHITIDHDNKI